MKLFTVGTEVNYPVGDSQCPECWEQYPEPCGCGGLMHAAGGLMHAAGGLMHAAGGEEQDADGNALLITQCDQCGRSEDSEVY